MTHVRHAALILSYAHWVHRNADCGRYDVQSVTSVASREPFLWVILPLKDGAAALVSQEHCAIWLHPSRSRRSLQCRAAFSWWQPGRKVTCPLESGVQALHVPASLPRVLMETPALTFTRSLPCSKIEDEVIRILSRQQEASTLLPTLPFFLSTFSVHIDATAEPPCWAVLLGVVLHCRPAAAC